MGSIIRELSTEDIRQVLSIVHSLPSISPHTDALSYQFQKYFEDPRLQSYIVCEENKQVVGFAGWSKAAGEGAYLLEWIAVSKNMQRKGVGRELLGYVEDVIRPEGARLLIVETFADDPLFAGAEEFYMKNGFAREAIIKNYYSEGKDKAIYVKRF
jgi:ribosomal protein S18 acetylase RimI-like enzyme